MKPRLRKLAALAVLGSTKVYAGLIGNAKDDDESPAGVTRVAAGERDRALLNGVLNFSAPAPAEVRAMAAEDLAFLQDPRALNVLAQAVLDHQVPVQRAALRAIAAFRHPRAEQVLRNVCLHPSASMATRTSALQSLVYQRTHSSLAFLKEAAGRKSLPAPLREAAHESLKLARLDRAPTP